MYAVLKSNIILKYKKFVKENSPTNIQKKLHHILICLLNLRN